MNLRNYRSNSAGLKEKHHLNAKKSNEWIKVKEGEGRQHKRWAEMGQD
jgi:hypothetical protein